MNEYVIINKTAIQKKIEELEEEYKSEPVYQLNTYGDKLIHEIMILNEILSQSTPLIPEIEKAFDAGNAYCLGNHELFEQTHSNKEYYISNLKLDI